MHNAMGYDIHLLVKELKNYSIKVIPNNEEKYISLSVMVEVDRYIDKNGKERAVNIELRFIDSYKFMAASLDSLVKNNVNDLNILSKYFRDTYGSTLVNSQAQPSSTNEFALVKRKGVYPYEYINSVEKFNDTKLPPIEAFHLTLSGQGISNEDYEHAQNVWKVFNMKTFRDYHELYNIADVLQLADVFENFRKILHETHKLDPAWYYTLPGYSWDAMLKYTKQELELLDDIDMVNMIKAGTRGGISSIMHRFARANNKYMTRKLDDGTIHSDYNPKIESSYIMYLDANNLYGWAMNDSLPYS